MTDTTYRVGSAKRVIFATKKHWRLFRWHDRKGAQMTKAGSAMAFRGGPQEKLAQASLTRSLHGMWALVSADCFPSCSLCFILCHH